MPRARISRRSFLYTALATGSTLASVSCGTLLFPERRGQRSGRLDPAVILLDGLLLVLFLVPGVIAFAVDIYTGAIYLPPSEYGHVTPTDFDRDTWERVDVAPGDLTPARVEQVVFERTGHHVRVDPAVFQHRNARAHDEQRQPNSGEVRVE